MPEVVSALPASKPVTRLRMTPAELSKLLIDWDLNQSQFARLFGFHPRTVRSWVAGDAPVPSTVVLLLLVMNAKSITPDILRDLVARAAK